MLIKDHNGHFEIKRTSDQAFPYLRIAATIQTSSGNFSGENNGVLFCGGEAGKARLQSLKAFQTNEVLVNLTEGCSIEIRRLPRGNMEVQFSITVSRSGSETSMRGLITVDGEYSLQFVEALWNEIV